MEQAFDQLRRMIEVATSSISWPYFQLPVADADAVYRERVYCYELYHQLRCIWGAFPFSLGGEVDKSGNPHFQNGPYAHAKPDLIIHTPGDMDENLATVEVKSATVARGAIGEDLQKVSWFCRHARYFKGVFLIYGDAGDAEAVSARLRNATDDAIDLAAIEYLYHRRVGEPAQWVTL